MNTLIINESLSQDLIIPDDNIVTIPIQIEKNGKQYFPVFDESIGGRNYVQNSKYRENPIGTSTITLVPAGIYLDPNDTYTISFDYEYLDELDNPSTMLLSRDGNIGQIPIIDFPKGKIIYTFKHSNIGNTNSNLYFYGGRNYAISVSRHIIYQNIKLKKGTIPTDWTPAPEELLELSTITSNFCKVTKDNNNIILSDFSADQGYIEFEVPYGDDWTINHMVNITRDIKFRPLAFDNRLLKFQDRLLHIRETPHIMYSELMDYAYSNNIETPPTSNLRALNYLYKNLESEGLDMFDLLYNFSYIDTPEQFKLLNLWNKRDYDGTAYGGLMWSNEGVQGNGVNGYIDTHLDLSVTENFKQDDSFLGAHWKYDGGGNYNVSVIGSSLPLTGVRTSIFSKTVNGNRVNNSDTPSNISTEINSTYKIISRTDNKRVRHQHNIPDTLIFDPNELNSLPPDNKEFGLLRYATYSLVHLSVFFLGGHWEERVFADFRKIYNKYLSSIGLTPIA